MGVEVVDERPYELDGLPRPSYIYDFGLRYTPADPRRTRRELFQDAVAAVWEGRNEADGFNALVLAAGLTWRQATVLRAYAKYMRQGGTPFAQDYIEDALKSNVDITAAARRSSSRPASTPTHQDDGGPRPRRPQALEQKIRRALDDVVSLDHDRILRSYLTVIGATLRTNYYQRGDGRARPSPTSRSSCEPTRSPTCPQPRPRFEIFVYSPRVEGVHLRFGAVARGGLRWSDRRDDFRTEVLGLVKAQMVKNAVIVPVGAKGGFFCKQLPDPRRPRGVDGRGRRLLHDVHLRAARHHRQPRRRRDRAAAATSSATTATTPTSSSPPTRAPRPSPTSPTASPRTTASGSATPSPPAARSATTTRRWASPPAAPGSRCKRHFREMGVDCQTEDFTCVGIGDMSGDVFGNGMLLSEHIRLVAAFDHRDIFLDPDPDAGSVVRRAQAALRAAALELAGLRQRA